MDEISDNLSAVGARIRAERERLGKNQTDFAQLGGVNRSSQAEYESGKRPFSANYLIGLAEAGVDVAFIVTGRQKAGQGVIPETTNSRRPLIMLPVVLPTEDALSEMFEGLLEAVDRSQSVVGLARELAQLLPTGLSQLQDLLPDPGIRPSRRGVELEVLASADRERTP